MYWHPDIEPSLFHRNCWKKYSRINSGKKRRPRTKQKIVIVMLGAVYLFLLIINTYDSERKSKTETCSKVQAGSF